MSKNQPIGFPLPEWQEKSPPPATPIEGQYCRIEKLDPSQHAASLFTADQEDKDGSSWTYMPYGPFADWQVYLAWAQKMASSSDPLFYAILDKKDHRALGVASYLRIDPPIGVIEVGHIHLSPSLQRTRIATEMHYLMMKRVFDEMGYRRYEWKCDALNEPSRKAALRLGFTFEGIFRQATIYKKRNRDTAWFSILDKEWPALKAAFEAWLHPENFDSAGRQIRPLKAQRSV